MISQWTKGRLSRLCAVALLGALLATGPGGCNSKPKRAQVTGTVKLKGGKVVTAGTVNFWLNDKIAPGSAPIGSDGTYTVTDAPVGDVKITVTTPRAQLGMGGMPRGGAGIPNVPSGMPADKIPEGMKGDPLKPGNVVPVNEKYSQLATTTLAYTVTESKEPQRHDITDLDP